MVIDTSAIIAILLREPEAYALAQAISRDRKRLLSAFSLLECSLVIAGRKGDPGLQLLDTLIKRLNILVIAMDADQSRLAREGWLQFGKGRHKAGLNIGDCCSYALARQTGEPLLFKGNDFSHSDIPSVKI